LENQANLHRLPSRKEQPQLVSGRYMSLYESIKSNPGNMTPGVGKASLDRIDVNWFHRISAT